MKKLLLMFLLLGAINASGQNQEINGTLITTSDISVGKDVSGKWGEGRRLYFRGVTSSSDPVWLAKYTESQEVTGLRINIGDGPDNRDYLSVGTTHWDTKQWSNFFTVRMDGHVGIGVAQPKSKLDVNGTIRAKEVKIEATGWSDFVFADNYKLPTLYEVEQHIKEHKHLPDVPSEKEVLEEGVNVVEMQAKLLQKIEELTLYVIELKKENEEMKQEIQILKNN